MAPVFSNAQSGTQAFAESAAVVLDIAVSDPEGSALTLSLSGTDASRFTLNSATKRLSLIAQPNFERPGDANADNSYDITIAASDGALSTSKSFAINITDAPEALENNGAVMVRVFGGEEAFATVSLGDIDADQQVDLAFGDLARSSRAGESFVVSGATLSSLQSSVNPIEGIDRRVTIKGSEASANAGTRLAAGDIDGDQRLDLFVAETFLSGGAPPNPKTVVVRASDLATLYGATLDTSQVAGPPPTARLLGANTSLSLLGDIDGDAVPEVVIADHTANTAANLAGIAYVLPGTQVRNGFGSSLTNSSAAIVRILGPAADSNLGYTAAALKDFDGDGLGDLFLAAPGVTGAPQSFTFAYFISGAAIRDARASGTIDLAAATLPTGVVRFTSPQFKVLQAAPVGDVNGDGKADLLISSFDRGGSTATNDRNVAWLFFGGTALSPQMDLGVPATAASAVAIRSHDLDLFAGFQAVGAGDVDHDGKPDILISDPVAGGTTDPGAVYLVFGSALQTPGIVQLDTLQALRSAVLITGAHSHQNLYTPPSAAGDVNGDGFGDVVLAGHRLNLIATDEFFILSGKMLTAEKTQDASVSIAALFPEIVGP